MSNFDFRAINQFVQAFKPDKDRLEKVLAGHETPGRVPSMVIDYNRARYAYDDEDQSWGESQYTTDATPSAAAGSASMTVSSYNPSFWSHHPSDRSSGVTSQPSTDGQQPDFTQALLQAPAFDLLAATPRTTAGTSHPLWCELCDLRNCQVTFHLNQTDEWIQHHIEHLKDDFPGKMRCWFCDDVTFNAANKAYRFARFQDRMEHIRQHIVDEYRTVHDMRPDFDMITHLGVQIIPDNMYRRAVGYDETPEQFRLPGSSSQAQQQSVHHWQERRPAGPGLAHNLDRERRHQRERGSRAHGNRSSRH